MSFNVGIPKYCFLLISALVFTLFLNSAHALSPNVEIRGQQPGEAFPSPDGIIFDLTLDPGTQAGQLADWFLVAATPSHFYYFDVTQWSWQQSTNGLSGLKASVTSPAISLAAPYTIEGLGVPEPGSATDFYFALDLTPNGMVNLDESLTFDSATWEPPSDPPEEPEPDYSSGSELGKAMLLLAVLSDPSDHFYYIFNSWTLREMKAQCKSYEIPPAGENGAAALSCEFTPPFVNGPGTTASFPELTGQVSNGSFLLSGTGVVAGIPNITVTFEGSTSTPRKQLAARQQTNCDPGTNSWMYESLTGTMTFGANGRLPTGAPLIANATLTLPPTSSVVTGSSEAGSSWMMISADKDVVAACSLPSSGGNCLDVNLADTTTIVSRNAGSERFDMARSYFHFTLPNLAPGTIVEEAYINIYDVENMITPSNDSFPLGVAASAWNANTITWDNQPNQTTGSGLGVSIGPFIEQFRWRGHALSIDAYINQIYSGQTENNGFILDVNNTTGARYSRGFFSVNNGAATAPRLYLKVNSPVALSNANVTMPAPPTDVEIPSYLFMLGDALPETACFASN